MMVHIDHVLAYCIDKELFKAIDYFREQLRVLIEHRGKESKRILLAKQPAEEKGPLEGMA